MHFREKNRFVQSAAAFAGSLYDRLTDLPPQNLADFSAGKTALFLVDLVNGFALEGPMSSPRVGALLPGAADLAARCASRGIPIVAFADAHTPDSLELLSYPPHCLRGTAETEICASIAGSVPLTRIEKNSTNGFVEPAFEAWLSAHSEIDTYLVAGDCTDICIQQFVLTAKAWHNTRNRPLRLILPLNLTDTFDAPEHPADVLGAASLYFMQAAGAELCAALI